MPPRYDRDYRSEVASLTMWRLPIAALSACIGAGRQLCRLGLQKSVTLAETRHMVFRQQRRRAWRGASKPGHVSRARLHSSGAAAARAYKTDPESAAGTAEVAATLSYDELLDARYA